jgi:hypothetical protein
MAVKLKIFLQSQICMPGCGWCQSQMFLENREDRVIPNHREDANGVGKLIPVINERYGQVVDVSIINPWSLFAFWDCFRLNITPVRPAWVLGGKKICEGVPEADDLLAAMDAELVSLCIDR